MSHYVLSEANIFNSKTCEPILENEALPVQITSVADDGTIELRIEHPIRHETIYFSLSPGDLILAALKLANES